MTALSEFLLHSTVGRVLLVFTFLVVSLFLASVAGWLPAAF